MVWHLASPLLYGTGRESWNSTHQGLKFYGPNGIYPESKSIKIHYLHPTRHLMYCESQSYFTNCAGLVGIICKLWSLSANCIQWFLFCIINYTLINWDVLTPAFCFQQQQLNFCSWKQPRTLIFCFRLLS